MIVYDFTKLIIYYVKNSFYKITFSTIIKLISIFARVLLI